MGVWRQEVERHGGEMQRGVVGWVGSPMCTRVAIPAGQVQRRGVRLEIRRPEAEQQLPARPICEWEGGSMVREHGA